MKGFYRTLDAGLWGDGKFRDLSRPQPCGQYLWVYILTGDHTDGLPGLYKVGEAALAESLGWPLDDLRRVFGEIESRGMAAADWEARVMYVPSALKYQPPQNPKHLKGWGKAFRGIPECKLKDSWLQQLAGVAQAKGKPYVSALIEGFDTVCHTVCDTVSPPNPNPQSNPNEDVPDALSVADNDGGQPPAEDIPFDEIILLLNQRSGKAYRIDGKATMSLIGARWQEGHRFGEFEQVIEAKCAEWKGTEMEKYLRPETLFGPKFESYLNERPRGSEGGASAYPSMDDEMEKSGEC